MSSFRLTATLFVLWLVVWPGGAAAQTAAGSVVPCLVPMRWTLTDIDAGFGITRSEAQTALSEAIGLWEAHASQALFSTDGGGHPISFVFDERQESVLRRRTELDAVALIAAELDEMRLTFDQQQALQGLEVRDYEEAVGSHGAEMGRLNAEISAWNARGDLPDSVRTRLQDTREVLAERGEQLDRRRAEVQDGNEGVMAASRRLNQLAEEYNNAQARLSRIPIVQAQAGRYSERVTTRDGEVEEIRRQIRVFFYDRHRDLVSVLAHELGHALGLGHTSEPGAVMSEVSSFSEREGLPDLHPRDLEMLDATCPTLRGVEVPVDLTPQDDVVAPDAEGHRYEFSYELLPLRNTLPSGTGERMPEPWLRGLNAGVPPLVRRVEPIGAESGGA